MSGPGEYALDAQKLPRPNVHIAEGQVIRLSYEPYTPSTVRPAHEELELTVENGKLVIKCVRYGIVGHEGHDSCRAKWVQNG